MNPFYSVRFRLFALCVSLLVVLGGANLFLGSIIHQRGAQEEEQREEYHRVDTIHSAERAIHAFRHQLALVNNALLVNNPAQRERAEKLAIVARTEVDALLAGLSKFDGPSAASIRDSLEAYPEHMRRGALAIREGSQALANEELAKAQGLLATMFDTLRSANQREKERVEAVLQREMERAKSGVRWSAGVVLMSTAFGLILAFLILRSIVRPLQSTVVAIRQVNAGEMSVDLPPISGDEFGDMAIALRQFRDQAERLRRMAYNDPLTGLGNRARLDESLRARIDYCRKHGGGVAVLYVDLDNFSAVNDSLGHSVGDRYLCEAALRLQRFIPPETLVCRYSGDKFIVLLEGSDAEKMLEETRGVSEVVLHGLSEPYQLAGNMLPMSVSIGIAIYPSDGQTGEELISGADAAMYLAKRSGRNKAQYANPDLTLGARKQLATATEIRRGLENGEFEPFYQPVVDVTQNRVVGAEALLRWRHPVRGLVPAGEFIPAAEASGLIQALGEQCATRANQQVTKWLDSERAIRVSVNLSPRQIEDGTVIQLIEGLHRAAGTRPTFLDFEITETAMLERVEQTQETLQRIRAKGHRLSVDDFGTGYSSLVYLQRFPLDRIKIDRSFVSRIELSREAQAIISATVALARSLEMEVIAEGVETEGQMRRLCELGCTLQQGFYFTPALPAKELESWMDARADHRPPATILQESSAA